MSSKNRIEQLQEEFAQDRLQQNGYEAPSNDTEDIVNLGEVSEEEKRYVDEKAKADAAKKEFFGFVWYLLAVLVSVWLIITFVGQRTIVDGSSMRDTLEDGDNLIVDKITYRFSDPERFDVICFPPSYDPKEKYIKRIIGLPGETVYIDADGAIYINGRKIEEHYGLEVIEEAGTASNTIILDEDEYFVLGDNRNNSTDSRFQIVGNVKRSSIIGKAWVRIYPFNKMGLVKKIK